MAPGDMAHLCGSVNAPTGPLSHDLLLVDGGDDGELLVKVWKGGSGKAEQVNGWTRGEGKEWNALRTEVEVNRRVNAEVDAEGGDLDPSIRQSNIFHQLIGGKVDVIWVP